jgi:hypothetical protein
LMIRGFRCAAAFPWTWWSRPPCGTVDVGNIRYVWAGLSRARPALLADAQLAGRAARLIVSIDGAALPFRASADQPDGSAPVLWLVLSLSAARSWLLSLPLSPHIQRERIKMVGLSSTMWQTCPCAKPEQNAIGISQIILQFNGGLTENC